MKGFLDLSSVEGKPIGTIPRCGACKLCDGCDSPKMKSDGKGELKVLIVGDSPHEDDDRAGRLFESDSGQYLRQVLAGMDIDLDVDAWTTNALICYTGEKPEPKQIEYCRPNLLNLIEEVEPNVIVPMGHSAIASVLGPHWKRIGVAERWMGWQIPLEKFWVCPTFHPSFLRRQKNELFDRQFADHLDAAFDIEDAPLPRKDWRAGIEVLLEEDEIWEGLREMAKSEWVAFDYETNCLKPDYPKAKILCCGMSNGKRTIAYPWTPHAAELTSRVLRGSCKKIASNLKMEESWTEKFLDHPVENWGWDTMLAAHCFDNRPGITSIKFQALTKLGCPSYNDSLAGYINSEGWYNRLEQVDLKQLLLYCGMDCILEWEVAMMQRKEMGYE